MSAANYIGGFIKWLLHKCRTKLNEELNDDFILNTIIGYITVIVLFFIILLILHIVS